MKNEKQTSNLNFNVQLFWKSEHRLFWCFRSQLQYKNENQNFISNFIFQFIKKPKWHFGYTEWDSNLKDFCNLYLLKNLIKKSTCFKNPENPKTIDLILTNRSRSSCNSDTLETGISDFHKLNVTVLITFFKKQSPKVISYRNYKFFFKWFISHWFNQWGI